MRDALFLLGAFVATYLAFASFALVQKRHWRAVTGAHDATLYDRRFLKTCGTGYLVAGCAIVMWQEGADYGALLWVTQLIVAACSVVATLSLRPQLLKPLATISALTQQARSY